MRISLRLSCCAGAMVVLIWNVDFPVLGAMASMSASPAMHISFWPACTASYPCASPNLHIPGDLFSHGTVALAISILQTQLWPIVNCCPGTWHNIFGNQLPQNLIGVLCQSSQLCKGHPTFNGPNDHVSTMNKQSQSQQVALQGGIVFKTTEPQKSTSAFIFGSQCGGWNTTSTSVRASGEHIW